MTDINALPLDQKIAAIGARIVEAQRERSDLEASANAHEAQAREDRRAMTDLKKEIGELTTVLQHTQVQKKVLDAQAAATLAQIDAEKARVDAEASAAAQRDLLADIEAKSQRLDELLAKAEAAAAPPPEPPPPLDPPTSDL